MYDVGFMCEKDEKEQRDDYYFAHTNVVTKCSLGFWPITPQYYIFNDVHRTKHGSGSFLAFNDGGFITNEENLDSKGKKKNILSLKKTAIPTTFNFGPPKTSRRLERELWY